MAESRVWSWKTTQIGPRSSATTERQRVSYMHVFLGSINDRALHWTPHLLYKLQLGYNRQLKSFRRSSHSNRQKLLSSTTPLSFETPAKRNPREYLHAPCIIIFPATVIGQHFCRLQYGSVFIQVCAVGSKIRIFSVPECVLAVQGHPRSMILVPIESAYMRLPICPPLWLWSYLAPFLIYGDLLAKNCLFSYPLSFGALAPYVPFGILRRS